MNWFENKTTQLIALVGIVTTLAGFGYQGAAIAAGRGDAAWRVRAREHWSSARTLRVAPRARASCCCGNVSRRRRAPPCAC